ncbi:MAG TPA: 50S ribosomal protein L11 methyltransferase [Thermoplasmata archaeon]|nr:50S ribosomal protein L11 methyltransferase [Thermoplasmata archaeon]
MRRAELVRLLQGVPAFVDPRADLEQVVTPAEAAATLLALADRYDGLRGRSVVDLGCGTGRLALGAAALGASPVLGVDVDPTAVAVGTRTAASAGLEVELRVARVDQVRTPADIVVMNPPFGAQRQHADRPFWDAAYALARRSIYAFSLAASRTFIARRAVDRAAHVLEIVPVPWVLGRTFPHHSRPRVDLDVDLWAIRTAGGNGGPRAP